MRTPDTDKVSRLVIANLYPLGLPQRTKHLLHSEPLPVEAALSLGQKAMKIRPEHMGGRAFVEGVAAPATIRLVCEHCNERKNPYNVRFLRLLLNVD